jgi:diguanylate cyclase (GGDEF)-like protein
LGKPLAIDELTTRISVQAERIRLMRERSDRDHLSGLMLRRVFVETLQRSLAVCCRENKPLALVLFDLDHFKQINDQHGHLVGDRVIATFGELLRRRFRVEDLRGRWGGEEFVLAFPGQTSEFAQGAAERLLKEFSKRLFETEGGGQFSVTFTAGVASYPEDGESLDVLLKRADDLLYEGKALGRGCVRSRDARVAPT